MVYKPDDFCRRTSLILKRSSHLQQYWCPAQRTPNLCRHRAQAHQAQVPVTPLVSLLPNEAQASYQDRKRLLSKSTKCPVVHLLGRGLPPSLPKLGPFHHIFLRQQETSARAVNRNHVPTAHKPPTAEQARQLSRLAKQPRLHQQALVSQPARALNANMPAVQTVRTSARTRPYLAHPCLTRVSA